MNLLFLKYKNSWFIVFCLTAVVAIVACNLWLLYWGHCVFDDFFKIPTIGWGLICANFIAALIFSMVRRRNKKKVHVSSCSTCEARLRDSWIYCPNCGDGQGA